MDARSTTFIMNISQNVVDNETKYNIGILPDSFFNNASDADSSGAPGLISGLQGSMNVNRGALLLVPQRQCISSFVLNIYHNGLS